ncbi:acyl-CoA dehydrogenase family protein [Zavarzinia compransoris]|uniref:Acyl-CoA dehydrogenase n=1 Tax=Zavarzinia compransoris TaxID=1264899 RepID=A0A317DT86_9PROT|nr:acyl-CoA dehydrogenase family protein [Zavarzinia compransoris]PWR17562.1 acyl-CoA dehydrogenase [Zavarzinia compransoris]TDP49220.1 alkylation response protein AidB-like acyl-CoA dehydrogenase [Zavarzinia compransoris]
MKLSFSAADEAFRAEIAGWLRDNLTGAFAALKNRGGPGDEHAFFAERRAFERHLGLAGWVGVGWPKAAGGRGVPLSQQVIFYEEYARAGGPGRVGHIGEGLAGPTLIAFGTEAQQQRFLPGILSGDDLWCQGYSEPSAGSDLANVRTRARRVGDRWVIDGQKVWTSLAHVSDWCFVIARTEEGSSGHRGLSYLLVPMRQKGIEVRPIQQMTGTSEFNEVFFDGAETAADNIVGQPGEGWKVAMGTLAFERGASTLGQQMAFHNQLNEIIAIAKANGRAREPLIRQRLAEAWIGLQIMRANALRMLAQAGKPELPREAYVSKLYWATWHRDLGKLAMDVLGPEAEVAAGEPGSYALTPLQQLFLFTRSDTIYAGTNEIQRNIIAERALGMPRDARA